MDKNIRKIGKHFLMFEKGTIPGVNIARMKGLQYALPAPTKRERRDMNFKTRLYSNFHFRKFEFYHFLKLPSNLIAQ